MKNSHDEDFIQDCIFRDGDAMMAVFGFKRGDDGAWNQDELSWLFDQIDQNGIVWMYDRMRSAAAVMAE
jgi:hypothetical protein